jgi:hypothetical protein
MGLVFVQSVTGTGAVAWDVVTGRDEGGGD